MPFSGRRPGWYTWAVLITTSVVSAVLAVTISVQITQRQRIESDRKLCASIRADVNTYLETPPSTAAGKAQRDSKIELLRVLGCPRVLTMKG